MQSLTVIIMCELRTPAANAWPTAGPWIMEAVDPHLTVWNHFSIRFRSVYSLRPLSP